MKVILLQDIKALGKKGDIKEVAEGYGRNFLIPRKLAIFANKENMTMLENEVSRQEKKEQKLINESKALALKINDKILEMEVKSGGAGKLFGSVTNADIAGLLEKQGINIDKRKIETDDTIKAVGDYQIVLKLHPGVQANFTLRVKAESKDKE